MATRESGEAVDARIDEWVEAGLISPEQGDAIHRYEARRPGRVGPDLAEPPRLTPVAEVAAYVGAVLALTGGAFLVAPQWDDLGFGARLAVALAVAVVGLVGGTALWHVDDAATRRIGGFAWLVGTAGAGLAAGVVADRLDASDGAIAIAVGAAVLVIGGVLWWNRERPSQVVGVAAGAGIIAGGVGDVTDAPVWTIGAAVWMVAATAFVLAATGALRPRVVVLAVSLAGLLVGAAMLGELEEHLGPAVAVASAAAAVGFAVVDRSTVVLVLSIVGLLVSVQVLLTTVLTGATSAAVVALVGLAIVGVVVVRAVRSPGHGPAT